MRIKHRVKCKGGMRVTESFDLPWIDIFIKDKWYDVEFSLWSDSKEKHEYLLKLNGGFKDYYVTDELGNVRRLSRPEYNSIFYTIEECRNHLIDDIIT